MPVPAVSQVSSGASASFPPRGLACQLSSCTTASTTSAAVPLAGRGSVCLRLTRHREASSFQPPGCGQKEQKKSQGSHCAWTDGHGQSGCSEASGAASPCPLSSPAASRVARQQQSSTRAKSCQQQPHPPADTAPLQAETQRGQLRGQSSAAPFSRSSGRSRGL